MEFPALFHIAQEAVALILGLLILKDLAPLAKRHRETVPELFWLEAWAGFGVVFTLIHIILASSGLPNLESIIPLTYLPERISDSVFALFAVFPPKSAKKYAHRLLGVSSALILFFVAAGVYAFENVAHSVGFIGRPQELLQVIPAAIVFGRLLDMKKGFGKFLKWSTLATLFGGSIMLLSHGVFDTAFDIAHYLKIVSYGIVYANIRWLKGRLN